jgi:hypothetical protein
MRRDISKCSVAGCSKRSVKKGCCLAHYPAWLADYRHRREARREAIENARPHFQYEGREELLIAEQENKS